MGQASANGLIEAEGTSGDDVTGAQDQDWFVAIGLYDPRHLAMAGGDPALMAALQDRMAIRMPFSKILTSSARVCTSTTRFRVASGTL